MEYGININFFAKTIGMRKSAELIAKAGFTNLDYTPPLKSGSWKEEMKEAVDIFKDLGLTVHQTHAPYNRYGSYNGCYQLCLDRCAEATAYMGAKFMVTHGDEFDFENSIFSPEAALEYNHSLFLPYVVDGGKNGYKVAFETVFEDSGCRRRFTSDADELLALITSFESKNAVCCWDFGHAHVSFNKSAPDIIRRFGQLIQCTHVHDNPGCDSHQIPMTGNINWKAVMDAFKEIQYKGIISIEYAHGNMAEHLMAEFINLTYSCAAHLWTL